MNRKALCSGLAVTGLLGLMLISTACGGSNNTNQAENTTPAAQQPPAKPPLTDADKSFMSDAAKAGYAEIQLAKLALQKTHNKDVKDFAQTLVDDHEKMAADLAKLASSKSVTLPDSKSLAASFSEGKLKMYSGRHFDEAFASKMVDDHQDAVATFQKESNQGSDTDVKDFASSGIPTLQKHLETAQELQNKFNTHKGGKMTGK
jgi:putative membrane protein